MDINQQLTDLLNSVSENETVEFKQAKNDYNFDKLGKYFSALSNEANLQIKSSAWLVFGVKDDQTVVGSQYRTDAKKLHSLKGEMAKQTTNRITFVEIHTINHENGRVILFEIPAAPQGLPVAYKGHYYGRDGEESGALNIEEFERIRSQNTWLDWSGKIVPEASIEDICPDALVKAKSLFLVKNPKLVNDANHWPPMTFLNKAKLAINGVITRAALILLGKEESSHLISPANPQVTWILKDKDGIEKDYQHFGIPLLLNADLVFQKIRNLKYRYMVAGNLFPEEVEQYDPYIIREALNNCIAHQDYSLGAKISVVEYEDGRLCFGNAGRFIPESIEKVIQSDAPESRYRNMTLVNAMVNLNMIDTIGSGIKKMFMIQKKRFFPLPEYDLTNEKVLVTITGRVLDLNYAKRLAETPDLTLDDIILLDRVQKSLSLTGLQAKHLKKLKLIEGKRPNLFISAHVAKHADEKAQYMKNKGLDDGYYKELICNYLKQFKQAERLDIDNMLLDKLPDILDQQQKKDKVKNLLQSLRNKGIIEVIDKVWVLSK